MSAARRARSRRRARRWIAAALIVAAMAGAGLVIRNFGLGTVRIAGTSMNDTLVGGDIALVLRGAYRRAAPARGDVVECRFPGRADTYVKRVIGLPGDAVAFEGGRLTVNGQPVEEEYVSSPTDDYAIALGEDEYLVLGDNRAASYDSRMEDMGPIGAAMFVGRVRWILWPLDRMGDID